MFYTQQMLTNYFILKDVSAMNWLRRMMYGRYGNDQLGNFCFIVYLILFVLQIIFRGTIAGNILTTVCFAVVIIYFFRAFSRNIYQRQRENQKFIALINPIKSYFRFLKMKCQERGGTKALYRCARCHQIIRVPKGRGKIAITCPKCRFEFIKKT